MPESDLTHPWEGDVNEAVVEEWEDETTPFDRITTVIDTTTEPVLAKEVADRARVSETTARKHLNSLAEVGRISVTDTSNGRKYKRSATTMAMQRIEAIHVQYTRDELHDALREIRDELQYLRETHGADDPDDLAGELEPDASAWTDVTRWRSLLENLKVTKAALDLYDFDPDDDLPEGAAIEAVDVDEADAEKRTRGALAPIEPRSAEKESA